MAWASCLRDVFLSDAVGKMPNSTEAPFINLPWCRLVSLAVQNDLSWVPLVVSGSRGREMHRRSDLGFDRLVGMSTLAAIEAAAEALSAEQKQELLPFLAPRLRAERAAMPAPRF